MKHVLLIVAIFLACIPAAAAQSACPAPPQDAVSKQASAALRALRPQPNTGPDAAAALDQFYRPCNYTLAWTRNGQLTDAAKLVIQELQAAASKGLRPDDYGGARWGSKACALDIPCEDTALSLAEFDAELTIAATRYALDLSYGRINPRLLHSDFDVHPDLALIANFLRTRIVPGGDIHATFQQLEHSADGYKRAEAMLQHYLTLQQLPDVALPPLRKKILPDQSFDALPLLLLRLQQLGDLDPTAAPDPSCTYNDALVDAVQHFQQRHGLAPTGILDPATWRELSVPIHARTQQLALTLERWRWVQHSFATPPVVVNIPEYRLRAYDANLHIILTMPVIVGGAYHRRTPILQSSIQQIIFRPYWNVPYDIQQREIAPKLAKDPAYLARNTYEVVNSHGQVVHVSGADLAAGLRSRALRVRQVPGDRNSLGLIKFVFPNIYDVYMHGTPSVSLFQRDQRDLSHGCIRVQDPVALALWALRSEPGWSRERIEQSIAAPTTSSVDLPAPIPVLIVYGTAVVEENGEAHFFRDVYGYDPPLLHALDALSTQRARPLW